MITFQYEWWLGLLDGLFGAEASEASEAMWNQLVIFDKADDIGFNTYPCLYYQDPSTIPDDYYSRILYYTDKPVAFTEIGWYSGESIDNWESSKEEQDCFVRRFLRLIEPVHPVINVWSFMYEIFPTAPFKTMCLFDENLNPKPAYET